MRLRHPVVLAVAAVATAACSRPSGEVSTPPSAVAADPREVVAEVDGAPITRADLEKRAAEALAGLRQQEYDTLRRTLDEMIADRLIETEAATRKVSREALIKAEVDDRVPPPDPALLDALYEQNVQRFAGKTREEMAPEIRRVVHEKNIGARRQAFDGELRSKARIKVTLEPPRAQVVIPADAPAVGPATAPVTMVEFSDYECPYCRRAQSVVDDLLVRYKDKLRFVHRDFPLDGHPRAFPAARAARCAHEQDRFWDYHRGLLSSPGDFSDEDLRRRAVGLGLNASRFDKCLRSDKHDEAIRASVKDGARIGVTGTPAFFINGRMMFGARPIEQFQEVIDAELREGG
jgi:protein-disulfide isomerase